MANITPRKNKDGLVVYRIRVFGGRDSEGKQRIFQTTWKADPKRTESANKKALNKFAAEYEAKCLSGEVAEQRVLFGTYCRKLVDDKQRDGLIKISTANFYRSLYPLLHDIDGVPISLVNANTLNNLYRNLLDKPSIPDTRYRLKAKTDLLKLGAVPNKTQFSQRYGIASTTLNAAINGKSICDKNGFAHINPHSLRHSAASALIFGGVDPASVAKYLGHTSPQTTEKVYAHALEESRSRNSSIIGDFMFRNKPALRKEDEKEDVG